MAWLIGLFALTAFVYSAVGFGGGSTYIALLAASGMNYLVIPVLALVCNLAVVSGSLLHYYRAGVVNLRTTFPFIAASAPLAWLGGRLPISEALFYILLGITLIFAAVFMLAQDRFRVWRLPPIGPGPSWMAGGAVGLLSGLVGIGGGIFLAPLLHLSRWADGRVIAATCALFIAVNSAFGLVGQLLKWHSLGVTQDLSVLMWLVPAVIVGGQLGVSGSISWLRPVMLRAATAVLVLIVGLRLLMRASL